LGNSIERLNFIFIFQFVMKSAGLLDIINSIAVFQLIFFTAYLFLKGNKIPSVFFLKIYLVFQLLAYINYIYWSREYAILRPVLLIALPSMFIWAPALYFYIRSRLFKNFIPSWKLLIHAFPAFILMMVILFILLWGAISDDLLKLRQISYYIIKSQIFIYNLYSLKIIYDYRHKIKFVTSSDEKKELNWLFFITYGYTITSLAGAVTFTISGRSDFGWGYILFLVFLNFFFFKAILNPDKFLGIDEEKLLPVKLSQNKIKSHFREIDDVIDKNQLFLDPDLSLHNVAQAVKLSDRIVSQAIKLGVNLNFCDYINSKRIGYAKERLITTTNSERNVLEILYEAGFNSKSVFNTQFKKHTGQSPTKYREMSKMEFKKLED